jgi:hypothetical protein
MGLGGWSSNEQGQIWVQCGYNFGPKWTISTPPPRQSKTNTAIFNLHHHGHDSAFSNPFCTTQSHNPGTPPGYWNNWVSIQSTNIQWLEDIGYYISNKSQQHAQSGSWNNQPGIIQYALFANHVVQNNDWAINYIPITRNHDRVLRHPMVFHLVIGHTI